MLRQTSMVSSVQCYYRMTVVDCLCILPRTFSRPPSGYEAPPADRVPRTWRGEVPPAEIRKGIQFMT